MGYATNNVRVMKFGGTSVGDADPLRRAAELLCDAQSESSVVAVVSAMSGVTNALIEAATSAAAGDWSAGARLTDWLQCKHSRVVCSLIADDAARRELQTEIKLLASAAGRACDRLAIEERICSRTFDFICSTGEKLTARLLAAAIAGRGRLALAVDASTIVVTDDAHGAAEPDASATRARARLQLLPLIAAGVIPVVTGFIGATPDGAVTTLGRGGSDYSATLLGSALDAAEVVIWTDVDGVMTADPRLAPEAETIPQLSYAAATALAESGAKVLHPKTLRPVAARGIPVRVRNSFAPSRLGTLIAAFATA